MKRKAILWVLGFSALVIAALVFTACRTVYVDPFFHYHEPRTDEYFYTLDNQRSQNDGIVKHFSCQGMITGTSMTENFHTSDFGRYWDYSFIKIPLEGATFRETGDIIRISTVVGIMLVGCLMVISVLLSKIKINQALKLGED